MESITLAMGNPRKMMKSCYCSVVLFAYVSVAGPGCTVSPALEHEVTENTDRPVIASTSNRWKDPQNIPVCFVNGDGTSTNEEYIRDLVTSEYAKAGLCFTGWTRCSANPPCPSIRLHVGVPSDADGRWAGESYVGAVCKVPHEWTVWLRTDQLNHATVHEFGHAIGLHHEHARTDNLGECSYSSSEIMPEGGAIEYFTVYDADSVMSYCGQNRLTETDIEGIRTFYNTAGAVQCGGAPPVEACTYPCEQYGFTDGQCETGTNGLSWKCDGTCLKQVASCDSGGTAPACEQYTCSQVGFSEGECGKDQYGRFWKCDGTCLDQVASCSSGGSETPTSGPIDSQTLATSPVFEVVAGALNCRETAYTGSVVNVFAQGTRLASQPTSANAPQVVIDSRGKPWLRVIGEGTTTACYVSASYEFIRPVN